MDHSHRVAWSLFILNEMMKDPCLIMTAEKRWAITSNLDIISHLMSNFSLAVGNELVMQLGCLLSSPSSFEAALSNLYHWLAVNEQKLSKVQLAEKHRYSSNYNHLFDDHSKLQWH